jgi:hypothetical protein
MTLPGKLLAIAVVLALLAAPLRAKEEEDDPAKTFLQGIGKLLKKGDATAIAAHFPEKGKVELTLRGIKNDKYRRDQATSLLRAYFDRIEPKTAKLTDTRSTVGKFSVKYRVKADETEVTATVWVYFVKEEDRWTITGIVEG